MSRRVRRASPSPVSSTVLLAAVAALLPVPVRRAAARPDTNTLGSVGGTELIRIEGRRTYPDSGHLDLVDGVVLGGPRQRLDLVTALRGWLDDSIAVVPEERSTPRDETPGGRAESAAEMSDSQEHATTAALRVARHPGPDDRRRPGSCGRLAVAGKLRKGDVIVSVDGKAADRRGVAARGRRPRTSRATRSRSSYARGGAPCASVTTAAARTTAARVIGVVTRDKATYPFTVRISLKDVGGPSAGLMFALGIVDKLTPGSLTGGKFIAGTGTIDDDGKVGPIGGITQKMIGARAQRRDRLPRPGRQLRRGAGDGARRAAAGEGQHAGRRHRVAGRPARRPDRRPAAPASRCRSSSVRQRVGQGVGQPGHQVPPGQHRGLARRGPASAAPPSGTRRGARPRRAAPPGARGARPATAGPRTRPAACPARRPGGTISRSTASAVPSTSAGQTMPAEQLVEARVLGQLALVDRGEAAGLAGGQAELGGELGLPAQQVGGLDQGEQRGRLVPPGRRRRVARCRGSAGRAGVRVLAVSRFMSADPLRGCPMRWELAPLSVG